MHRTLKNGGFELSDTGVSSATVTTGQNKKVAAAWYFNNAADGGTNKTFTPTLAAFVPGVSISDAGNPKNYISFTSSGSETSPGTAAKALLYQRIYGTREENSRYGCFSFWAKTTATGGKLVAVEIRRNYGSGGSTEQVVGRAKIHVDSTWRRYFCTALFPDFSTKTFGVSDYIQVGIYLQAGSAALTESGPTVEAVGALPSATTAFAVSAAKFEIDAQLPSVFDPSEDEHFESEFVGRRILPVMKVTASATVDVNAELILIDPTAGNVVLTLPAVTVAQNRTVTFKRVAAGANTVTLTAAGSDTIDGAASLTMPNNNDSTTLVSDGQGLWRQIGSVLGSPSTGTVTSVDLTAPTQFAVTGNPVTSAGTLALAWVDQNAAKVLSGPATGADAAPTFRALVATDIPSLDYLSTTTVRTANTVFAGPTTGADAVPGFRALVAGDIPSLSAVYLPLSGGTLTGALVGTTATLNQIVLPPTVLTYAATTDIDLDLATFRTLALTGDVTFTTSNKATGKTVTIKILADSSVRNFTFPAWIFVGAAAPASIAANKTAILTITAFGTADTDIVAAYAEQP